MDEKVELGVVLSLEDDFSEPTEGILAQFSRLQKGADSLASGMEHSLSRLRDIIISGFTFKEMGGQIEDLGKKTVGAVVNVQKDILEVNSSFEMLQKQMLTAFKGNQEEASKAFDWIRDFAVKTPFQVENTTRAFQSLKASGIDVRETFKTAGGEVKTFLEAIGDLATRNMGQGGGIEGMLVSLGNVFSGQQNAFKSLNARFDIPKSEIDKLAKLQSLGDKQLMQGIVDLAYKITPNAMKNVVGTWDETISEMQDGWRNFLFDMGQTGVFDAMRKTLWKIKLTMDETLNPKLAESLKIAFTNMWKPIDLVADVLMKVVRGFGKLQESCPVLAQIALTTATIGGSLMVVAGFIMKLTGNTMIFLASMSSLILNSRLATREGITLARTVSLITSSFRSALPVIGAFSLAGFGLYQAWNRDLEGIRTKTLSVAHSISEGWKLAKKSLAEGGNIDKFLFKKYDFKMKIKIPPLTRIFAGKFLKVIALTKAFWQVFTGHFENGVMNFKKKDWELYENAGISGLVRSMVYAKDKVEHFFNGVGNGLTSVYGIMKEFTSNVWKPIQATIDSVTKYANNNPNGILGRLIIGENGVSLSTAEKHVAIAERLGKAVGIVLGTVASFKVMSSLTSIITKPFRALYKSLGGVKKRAIEAREELKKIALTNPVSKKVGGYITHTVPRVKKHFENNSRATTGYLGKSGKFRQIGVSQVDPTFSSLMMGDRMGAGGNLNVKKRSWIGKQLFGEKYYSSVGGKKTFLGQYGGILRMNKDNANIENKASLAFKDRPITGSQGLSVEGHKRLPIIGSPIGKVGQLFAKNDLSNLETSKKLARNRALSQFDRYKGSRANEALKEYMSLNDKIKGGTANARDIKTMDIYRKAGFNPSKAKQTVDNLSTTNAGRGVLDRLRDNRGTRAVKKDSYVKKMQTKYNLTKKNLGNSNANVFADNKQGVLSRLMTGQRLYTVEHDGKGNYSKNVVGRRGGIFNKKDGIIAPSIPLKDRLSQRFSGKISRFKPNIKMPSFLGNFGSKASSMYGGAKGRAMSLGGKVKSPFIGASAFMSKQLSRVGATMPRFSPKGIGKGALGFGKKVGRGAVGLGKGLYRGAGLMGGLAMRALPIASIGAFAMKGISARGAGVSAKQRKSMGLGKGASNFQVGLKSMQQSINKMNFKTMWTKFKKEAKGSFGIVRTIAKDVFGKLKQDFPKIMKDSFNGIKGIAILAWTFIKNHGVQILSSLGKSIMTLLGKAWTWVGANAGKVLGKIVQFTIGTVIPNLIAGVIKLGVFIITHIPSVLKSLVGIAMGIFRGLLAGVKQIFSGIAQFLWNAIKSAFQGIGNVLLNAIATPIRAIPVVGDKVANFLNLPKHHGGLWLSGDEHSAIIKQDETVLPPDKSRKLDALLDSNTPTRQKPVSEGRGKNIDNSIKIEKVEIVVKADKLSRSDARSQAMIILDELKKLKKEKQIRNHQDVDGILQI